MISLKKIELHFPTPKGLLAALDNITVNIQPGEKVALYGESGSGKSSLLNIIGLIETGYAGTYRLDEEESKTAGNSRRAKLRNKKIGFIFQDYNLLEQESVFENIRIPLYYSGIPHRQHRALIEEVAERAEIDHRLEQKVVFLSGGERQRVAVARALVNRPSIILADEPTGALNRELGTKIIRLLTDYADEGHTLILCTHQLEWLPQNMSRYIELKAGKIVSDESPPMSRWTQRHHSYWNEPACSVLVR